MKKIICTFLMLLLITGCGTKEKANNYNSNTSVDNTKSSQVSKGVNLDDLGNIMNGQYYFTHGDNTYYSSYDQNSNAHIYMMTNGTTKTIFNGFGWSFAVKGDYLYFSGNEGAKIDNTYNLYKMKLDGSSYEKINSSYTFNMNFFRDWLYYIKVDSSEYYLYRSDLDGKNEKKMFDKQSYDGIIYENILYYSIDDVVYRANPDGTNSTQVLSSVYQFIIGGGKIIYVDKSYNIKTTDIDGKNEKIVRPTDGQTIYKINSYKDNIYYIIVGSSTVDGYAYPYTLYSIKTDGTNDKSIYTSTSYGYYINIVNDKVYALDYNRGSSGYYETIAKSMNLDGTNVTTLYR